MNRNDPIRNSRAVRHRGIALILVLVVMALAAVLGYALLSASAMQATAGSNSVAAAEARAQAESGIHMAMYYLLNSANAPPLVSNQWANVTFGTMPGSVTVTVTSLGNNEYTVVSAGNSGTSVGGGAISRTITANIQVVTTYQIPQAAGFNSAVSVSALSTYTGSPAAISSPGQVTIASTSHVNGNVSAASFAGLGAATGQELTAPTTPPAPAHAADVNDYTQPYVYNGTQYYPVSIGPTVNSTTTLGPTPGNPLGVYYCTANVTINAPLTINGTLVVNGKFLDKSTVIITPVTPISATNMPALIAGTFIQMQGAGTTLTATGVVYSGSGVTGAATTATTNINITGALLITGGAVNNNYLGHLTVTYNNAYTNIPNFSSSNQTPTGVKIVSWSE